ncbi:hypothetical protein AVEN_60458-1 [Araneus ventricosus]|uniref:Uncharacterized protein n=1 Tax=Araneus ventricosus TaxID=182803 RepID=A0A4Y2KCP0_ARAVE|nr:hypothetical protein AVEN_60458-1 [Araneus ventricosus]
MLQPATKAQTHLSCDCQPPDNSIKSHPQTPMTFWLINHSTPETMFLFPWNNHENKFGAPCPPHGLLRALLGARDCAGADPCDSLVNRSVLRAQSELLGSMRICLPYIFPVIAVRALQRRGCLTAGGIGRR